MAENEPAPRPYVQVAAICQVALQEANNFLSIIRIIDRVPLQGFTPEMQPQPLHNFMLAIVLKSGGMRMKCQITVKIETPTAQKATLFESSALFEGEDRGIQIVAPVAYIAKEEGLYWFEISVEEDVLTKIPLRVMYQKIQPMPGMPFQAPPKG